MLQQCSSNCTALHKLPKNRVMSELLFVFFLISQLRDGLFSQSNKWKNFHNQMENAIKFPKDQTISEAHYGLLKSPKKQTSTQDSIVSAFCSLFGRIEETINCF